MAVITDLIAKLQLDTSQFKAGLSSAQAEVQSFSSRAATAFKSLAAAFAIGYVFDELAHSILDATHHVEDLVHSSERLGIGVEALEKLNYAANLSGVSTEQLNTSLKFMEKNLGNIELGLAGGKLPQYFKDMKLNVSELLQLPIEKQFTAITAAIDTMPDPLERAAARMAIFGRGGVVIGSMSGQVEKLSEQFDSLGIGLSTKQADAVVTFGKGVKELGAVWEGFKNQLAAALAGPLTEMLEGFEQSITDMGGMKVVAKELATVIIPLLKDMATLAKVAALPFEGLNDAIKATALASAKLAEIRAKSKFQDAKDFGTPAEIKAAGAEYANATRYVQGMRDAVKGVVAEQINLISIIPSIPTSGGNLTAIKDQLSTQESAVTRQIAAEKDRYQAQKDITDEMRKQVEASHSLYEEAKGQRDFDKQRQQDLDSISASMRQDQAENEAGVAHAGDRDKDLDNYKVPKDDNGHVLINKEDSERTAALKEEYNHKVDDRAEQIRHTALLDSIDKVAALHAQEEKDLLSKMNEALQEIKDALQNAKGGSGGGDKNTPQQAAKYNTSDGQAPWSVTRTGGGYADVNQNNRQQVQVNISAESGFKAAIANSSEVQGAVHLIVNDKLTNAAAAHQ